MRLHVRTDRPLLRTAPACTRHLLTSMVLPDRRPGDTALRPERPAVNVALVLDRSGSMGGEKFALVREAAAQALAMLGPRDRFSLIVYDNVVDVLAAGAAADESNRRLALARLGEIDARGSTDLASGWLTGADALRAIAAFTPVNRVLLLTDGLANQGITDPDRLVQLAATVKADGIRTSTFGVGADFDEELLRAMAEAGGGNFYFIEEAAAIPGLVTAELGDVLEVVARDAKLVLVTPPGVTVTTPQRWPVRQQGSAVHVELGDLAAGQSLDVLLALRFPEGEAGIGLRVGVGFADADNAHLVPVETVEWRYADPAAVESQPRDVEVDRATAAAYAAQARAEAVALNRQHRFDEAAARIVSVAERIRRYAGDDAELHAIVRDLAVEQREVGESALSAVDLKKKMFLAHRMQASKDEMGRSRRKR